MWITIPLSKTTACVGGKRVLISDRKSENRRHTRFPSGCVFWLSHKHAHRPRAGDPPRRPPARERTLFRPLVKRFKQRLALAPTFLVIREDQGERAENVVEVLVPQTVQVRHNRVDSVAELLALGVGAGHIAFDNGGVRVIGEAKKINPGRDSRSFVEWLHS